MTVYPNVALCGLLRSGKDTVAAYLCENYGYTRFAFGDGIRDVCRRLYPDQFANGTKPRALLQGVGQALRTFDDAVWVRECFRKISEEYQRRADYPWLYEPGMPVVISDLRQPNEAERCRSEGYVIIRVNAPEALRIHRAIEADDTFNLRDLTHETESYVDGFDVDYDVYNDGDLAELYAQIDDIMAKERRGNVGR